MCDYLYLYKLAIVKTYLHVLMKKWHKIKYWTTFHWMPSVGFYLVLYDNLCESVRR